MTPLFFVGSTARFDRLARALRQAHPHEFPRLLERAATILAADPFNRQRTHDMRKLEDVPAGHGQYRLRLGRFRFRYDIVGVVVELVYCGLRREDTYRT